MALLAFLKIFFMSNENHIDKCKSLHKPKPVEILICYLSEYFTFGYAH